jgi:hypothetical protein
MLAWPVSIDLPFSHLSYVADKHPSSLRLQNGKADAQFDRHFSASDGLPSSPVIQSGNISFISDMSGVDAMGIRPLQIQDRRVGLLRWYKSITLDLLQCHDLLI